MSVLRRNSRRADVTSTVLRSRERLQVGMVDYRAPTAMERLDSRARTAAGSLVALALSSGALFNGYNSLFGQAVCYIVNAAALLFLLAAYRPDMRFWRRIVPIMLCVGGAALWVALVNYGAAMVPGIGPPVVYAPDLFGAEMLGFCAGVLALLCGMILGQNRKGARSVILWLTLFNALWLLCGLVARALDADEYFAWTLARQGRFAGTIGNSNVTATMAGAMALIAAGEVVRAIRSYQAGVLPRLLLWTAVFILLIGAMISTASRFVAIIEIPLLALLIWMMVPAGSAIRHRRVMRLSLIVACIGAFGGMALGSSILAERLPTLMVEADNRMTMWGHYATLAAASPAYGYGMGSFPSLNAHFLPDAEMAQAIWQVNSAHNILLQLVLNGGLPYLLLLSGAAVLIGRTVMAAMARANRPTTIVAPALAVGHILLCGMVDIALDVPATVMVMLALAGTIWSRAEKMARG